MITNKTKNCKTGFACGSSCISKKKTCRKTAQSAEAKQKLDKVSKAVTQAKPAAAPQGLINETSGSNIDKNFVAKIYNKELDDLLTNLAQYAGKENIGEYSAAWDNLTKAAGLENEPMPVGSDAKKLRNNLRLGKDLTFGEGLALTLWVSDEYNVFNRHVLGVEKSARAERLVDYLDAALAKQPKATNTAINRLLEDEGGKGYMASSDAKGNFKLTRALNNLPVNTTAEGLLQGFKAFSFLPLDENPFFTEKETDVVMNLKAKDKDTQGVLADNFKNYMFEGEVLYGQQAKLNVYEIEFDGTYYDELPQALAAKKASGKNKQVQVYVEELD